MSKYRFHWGAALWLVAGTVMAGWVVSATDWAGVMRSLHALGAGLFAVALFRGLPLLMDTLGWRALLAQPARPSLLRMWRIRWIGESINTLLPAMQVGGDVVRARLIAPAGDGARAGAGVAADFAIGLIAQALFTLLAAAVLFNAPADTAAQAHVVLGLGVGILAAAVVFLLQRHGAFGRLVRAAARFAPAAAAAFAEGMDEQLRRTLAERRRLGAAMAWRFAGWFVRSGETWLILWFFGTPLTFAAALAIEGLANAVRSAAFFIPGAIGAQEGGIVALGLAFGLDAETALALALAKRGREILVSLPGLADWVRLERSRLLERTA